MFLFEVLIMSQHLATVIMLFPINCYFRYPDVALHYLTVWDGSWWSNLLLHWFQALRGFDWCICVNVETRGPAHLRKVLYLLVSSCGWGLWMVFRQIFMTDFQHDLLSGNVTHIATLRSIYLSALLPIMDSSGHLRQITGSMPLWAGVFSKYSLIFSTVWLRDICYCAW